MRTRVSFTILLPLAAAVACSGPAAGTPPRGEPAQALAPAAATATAPWAGDPAEIPQLVALAQHGPTKRKYPQADAVYGLDRDEITLQKDGAMVEHHKSIVRILDAQRGKAKFADVRIPYDTKRQTLVLQTARTVTDDGSVEVASKDEISDILPPELDGATMYSSVLQKVVSFPAVDTSSVLELEYTRTTRPGPDAALGGEALLADWDPILEREVVLTVPKDGVAWHVDVRADGPLAPAKTEGKAADGTPVVTYTYTEKDVPDRQPERDAPPEAAVLPRLVYSFLPDWNAAAKRIADRFLDAALPAKLPEAVQKQADALVAGVPADAPVDAKAARIYRFVAQQIRTVKLPLGWAGYAPNPPETVLQNRYGDDRDKVVLFVALCKAEGIPASPVLARDEGVPVEDAVPTVAQFDRLIARVGEATYVDPANEYGQYGVAPAGEDNYALVLAPGGGQLLRRPALDPKASLSKIAETFTLTDAGDLDARYRYTETGGYATQAAHTLRPLRGEGLKQFFQQAAARLTSSALDKEHTIGDLETVDAPIVVTQHVSVPGYSPAQGRLRVFELPDPTLSFADEEASSGLTERKLPLWIGTPETVAQDITLAVPKGWKVASLPPALAGKADGVTYAESCQQKGAQVTCHREVALTATQIAPEKYAAFHKAVSALDEYAQRVILLSK